MPFGAPPLFLKRPSRTRAAASSTSHRGSFGYTSPPVGSILGEDPYTVPDRALLAPLDATALSLLQEPSLGARAPRYWDPSLAERLRRFREDGRSIATPAPELGVAASRRPANDRYELSQDAVRAPLDEDALWASPHLGPIEARLARFRVPAPPSSDFGSRIRFQDWRPSEPNHTGMADQKSGSGPVGNPQRLSDATYAKIADVEAFNPPKSDHQAFLEGWLRPQGVNPTAWRLARVADPRIQRMMQEPGIRLLGIPGYVVGPDGVSYELRRPVLLDPLSASQQLAEQIARYKDLSGSDSDTIHAALADVYLAMALGAGRRGGPATRAEIRALQEKCEDPDWKLIGGGELPEKAIPGPGRAFEADGRVGSIFPDLFWQRRSNSQKFRVVNHVDVNASGKPTARELEVAERARRAVKHIDVFLEPKQYQLNRRKR
jgi:hypothetical protein